MDYRHDFEADWQPVTPTTLPPIGEKCLVSDGHIVILATCAETGEHIVWVFQGLTEENPQFKVIEWMPCPKPKLKNNENVVDQN